MYGKIQIVESIRLATDGSRTAQLSARNSEFSRVKTHKWVII
jgi:hypothetical protein